nr:MAG TPA: hypothetical protein [Caudoviricetes sp.]
MMIHKYFREGKLGMAIKKYAVRVEVNLCAENTKVVVVKAHTMTKAIKIVQDKLEKDGYRNVRIYSCVPV